MTITTFQTILFTAIVINWLIYSVVALFSAIRNAIYDRRREKRQREQAVRDLEYHQQRMKELD